MDVQYVHGDVQCVAGKLLSAMCNIEQKVNIHF